MKYKFNGCTEEEKRKIKWLFNMIKTTSAPNLMVRVSMHRPHITKDSKGENFTFYRTTRKHGYYRNINEHGFYDSEWDTVHIKKKCSHIIQLHLCDNETKVSIANVMAHEWRHYLQYTKPNLRKKYVLKNGHLEVDARRYADKVVNKLIINKAISGRQYPKQYACGWVLQDFDKGGLIK